MIGGILDGLMGHNSFKARAPRLDTKPGQQAINTQAQLGGDQALAQAYSLAASGRGGGAGGALAMREAQRRGTEATMNLQANAVAQQQALQQSALQQQANAEMQAQQINAGVAQQNAQGLQRLAGTALMAGAMMSDYRQKEMLSDFESKEAPGRFGGVDFQIPEYQVPEQVVQHQAQAERGNWQDASLMREPSALPLNRPRPARAELPEYRPAAASAGAAAFGLNKPRPNLPSLYDAARARNVADERTLAAQYQSQPVRAGVPQDAFSNRAIATHLRDRGEQLDMRAMQDPNEQAAAQRELDDRRARAAELFGPSRTERGLTTMGEYLMTSDRRAKEKAYADGVRAGSMRSPMTPGYGVPMRSPPMAPGYAPPPMTSDFQQKEALDPVQPTLYRYTPESSMRQAEEAAQRTFATTLEDKRAPRAGIVAQDLQRSSAFSPSVVQKDDGQLAIDRDRALSAALAELGGLHQRLKRLEGGKGRKRGA